MFWTHRLAYFCAEDTFGHIGTLVRSLVYLVMYYTFAQPRAVPAEMFLVTAGIVYCCTGTAYFLSQVRPKSEVDKGHATYSGSA